MNEETKKKLLVGIAVLTVIAAGTIGVVATKNTQQPTNEAVVEKKSEPKKSDGSVKEKNKTQQSDDIASKTYDQFGVKPESSTRGSATNTAKLTPKELVAVANVLKQQKKEQQAKATVLSPVVPSDPGKTNPDNPIVTPPVVRSTPEISYQKGLVIVKGTTINPYDYFTVSDSQDKEVTVAVDTSTLDTTTVGLQSFLVVATNKFGNHAVAKIPVYVASKPIISVQSETVQVAIGTEFNPMNYVQATDEVDGDLTEAIHVTSSTVNLNEEGSYSVNYSVINSAGVESVASMEVQVINGKPTITAPNSTHEINTPFDPLAGVSAVAFNGELIPTTDIHVIENTVDSSKEGTYSVTYQVSDRFGKESDKVTRTVVVENEAPDIHGAHDLAFPVGSEITKDLLLEGVTATDREDDKAGMPLVVSVNEEQFAAIQPNVIGAYPITYTAIDSMGKQTSKTITVKVVGEKPVIHGLTDQTIEVNHSFDPLADVSVTDKEDGTIPTSAIEITGSVDTTTPGTYVLTYRVTDSNGQQSNTYTRTITVTPKQAKEVETMLPKPLPQPAIDENTQPVLSKESSHISDSLSEGLPTLELNQTEDPTQEK